MGLVGYYRRFVESFSSIATPLTKLTQKKVKFLWSNACPGKSNVVADALSRLSMGSLSYVDKGKRGLVKDIYRLSTLGVCIVDFEDGGVIIYEVVKSSIGVQKKCVDDSSLIVPVEDVGVTDSLSYKKVLWRNQKVEEVIWEVEEDMKIRYPFLFPALDENA
ncbi:uncharacterized protein LOC124890516 [Capsicum annuum]|uniref:uncharacterized protein LOC124890516 n=1 Tax=Capsicum annuum TaxID=4072 RepID=UPI001FB0C736|nr:uncharacterized protein LOC124890516 [Capsicum annuum]